MTGVTRRKNRRSKAKVILLPSAASVAYGGAAEKHPSSAPSCTTWTVSEKDVITFGKTYPVLASRIPKGYWNIGGFKEKPWEDTKTGLKLEKKWWESMVFTTVHPFQEEALSSMKLYFKTSPWKVILTTNHMVLNSGNN